MKALIFFPFFAMFLVAGQWAELQLQPVDYVVRNLSDTSAYEIHSFTHGLHAPGDTIITDGQDTLIIMSEPFSYSPSCWTCNISTRIESVPAFSRDTVICDLTEAQIRQFEQDSSETVITRRLSTNGDTMYIAYVTKVKCRLKLNI